MATLVELWAVGFCAIAMGYLTYWSFDLVYFSFVFGDGDPNRDFERRRWALVGLCIQKNGGVVSAE